MDIQYAILGFLSWQPFSGYDLKKMISESDLFYWSGNNNQIYKSLVALHQSGLVSQEVQFQESLPARKVYSITPAGQTVLREWLLSSPELPEFHNNFLIQLAWTEPLSNDELEHQLGFYEEEIAIQYRMRQSLMERPAGLLPQFPQRSARETYLWKRIQENLLAFYQQELEWVRGVRQDIRKGTYNQLSEEGKNQ